MNVATWAPDLIAVGAGTAGLPFAIAAATASGSYPGVNVLILEKTDRIGGTLYRTGGNISAGGTRRQRARGIEDSPEQHYQDLLRISHGGANPELSRLACELAPGMADWLDENGFEFDPTTPALTFSHEVYETPRTFWGVEPGPSILAVLRRLIDPLITSGRVRIVFNTRVDRLLVEDNRVVGVAAGGNEYRANAVVLTTGGFTSNPDLFARLGGGYRPLSSGMPGSTGDGIVLAEALGAAIVNEGVFLPTVAAFADPDSPGQVFRDGADHMSYARLIPQIRPPWEIFVTDRGARFMREDEPDIEIREIKVKEQNLAFWMVWDEVTMRDGPPISPYFSSEFLRAEAALDRLVLMADSVTGLAAKMGVPAGALQTTVEGYNAAVESGAPDPFGRECRPVSLSTAPFYAAKLYGFANLSWAGLSVDRDLRVQRADGSVIPGLYAIGEVLGFSTFSGRAHVGGMSVGPALSLGRYLGARLGAAVAKR